jgi:lysophospholipase L1-like esterase
MMKNWRRSVAVIVALVWAVAIYASVVGLPFSHRIPAELIAHNDGVGFAVHLPRSSYLGGGLGREVDGMERQSSRARLFENDVELGPAHAPHASIRATGSGKFSDWEGRLYFSASDNSDPRSNGRTYVLRDELTLSKRGFAKISIAAVVMLLAMSLSRPGVRRRPGIGNAFMRMVAYVIAALCVEFLASKFRGVPFWLVTFAALMLLMVAVKYFILIVGKLHGEDWKLEWFPNLLLILTSVGFCVVVAEGYLAYLESEALKPKRTTAPASARSAAQKTAEGSAEDQGPKIDGVAALPPQLRAEMKKRRELLSLPDEWQLIKGVAVENATWAYSWHGVTHIFDTHSFRRLNGPFSEKRANTMRIVIVGDSMTYGAGIEGEWSYPSQLERALKRKYRVEVLNLGINGAESEDIKNTVVQMLPVLKPDLVIYGFCYNDFLPSGIGQYEPEPFPLPKEFKDFMREQSRLSRLVEDGYASLAMKLGITKDFYNDILKDLKGYRPRFARDVTQMNRAVRDAGLPPVISMPLDQFVEEGGRGHHISQAGEKLMRDAGMDVLSLDGYYRQYNGRELVISRWEKHPDEEANAIFASMLYDHLVARPDVQAYRIAKPR